MNNTDRFPVDGEEVAINKSCLEMGNGYLFGVIRGISALDADKQFCVDCSGKIIPFKFEDYGVNVFSLAEPILTEYEDAYYIDLINQEVVQMYYNPDSSAGGQYVKNHFQFNEIVENAYLGDTELLEYLEGTCHQYLYDIGEECFASANQQFLSTPTWTNNTPDLMKRMITIAKKSLFRQNIRIINIKLECEFLKKEPNKHLDQLITDWKYFPEVFDDKNNVWEHEYFETIITLSPEDYEAAYKAAEAFKNQHK